jgi:hypothetical protein
MTEAECITSRRAKPEEREKTTTMGSKRGIPISQEQTPDIRSDDSAQHRKAQDIDVETRTNKQEAVTEAPLE